MVTGQIKLTDDQQRTFDTVMRGDDAFITGGAGTGKSVLIKEIIRSLEAHSKNVVVCAPTGIAAVNIGGTTIHKAFGFPKGACITEKTCKLSVRTPKLIRMADVIVIDEVSMCRMDMMDSVCASVQKVRDETGRHIQMIVVGDFCQLPPVTVESSGEKELMQEFYKANVGHAFAFQAPGWRRMGFTNITLHDAVRQQDDDFIHYLNLLRRGDSSALKYFNAFASYEDDPDATKLCARNDDVDRLNEIELAKIPGEMITFHQQYYGLPSEMIYSPPPVSLKIGAKVIVLTNQSFILRGTSWKNGDIHNGSIGIVVDARADPDNPEEDYVIVSSGGKNYYITRKTDDMYSHRVDSNGKIHREIVGKVSYMPVKPGYAMTIHRSQGQTFDSIVLDPSCWDSGQLYVAISRLRSIEGLHLTREISVNDLHLAPTVKEFYDHLGDADYIPSWEKVKDTAFTKEAPDIRRSNILQFPVVGFFKPTSQPEALKAEEFSLQEPNTCPPAVSTKIFTEKESAAVIFARETPMTHVSPGETTSEQSLAMTKVEHDDVDSISSSGPITVKDEDIGPGKEAIKKARGRPARYTNKSKVCRIPIELVDEIKMMLCLVCPPKGGVNTTELERFKTALRELCDMDR
jgi:hypothetical protein